MPYRNPIERVLFLAPMIGDSLRNVDALANVRQDIAVPQLVNPRHEGPARVSLNRRELSGARK